MKTEKVKTSQNSIGFLMSCTIIQQNKVQSQMDLIRWEVLFHAQ